MKTIAQQLNIKSFPFEIHDTNGNRIYYEDSTGSWYKIEYDTNGNLVYYEDSNGCIIGVYVSNYYIRDNRPKPVKEYSMDEIAAKFGIPVEHLKIKK